MLKDRRSTYNINAPEINERFQGQFLLLVVLSFSLQFHRTIRNFDTERYDR